MSSWGRRIERAQELEREPAYGAARELLHYYVQLAQGRTELEEPAAPAEPDGFASLTAVCPVCHGLPVVAVLRPEGEGGKRSLVCSLCFREWEFRRLLCPQCGEEDEQKLPVYTADQFPYIRIEACDSCRTYIKCIDMTRNGLAVPEVDELAAVTLDIWANNRNYTKLQPNILGL